MRELIEREAVIDLLNRMESDYAQQSAGAVSKHKVVDGATRLLVAAFAVNYRTALRALPASTRYAELERAAREILAGIDESERGGWWCPTCQTWVPGKEVTYYESHEVCNTHVEGRDAEPETITALRTAIANLNKEAKPDAAQARVEEYAELERAARASLHVLTRCKEVLDSLECECDSYHGYICPIHSDKASVDLTINSLRAALATLDKEAKPDA